jgi:multidrug efflux pump subunit AcrA (membrane-fusion protein)
VKRALAIVLLSGAACSKHEAREEARPPTGEVWLSQEQMRSGHIEVAPVEERPVSGEVTVPGRIAFDDSRVAHVFSPVSGRVFRIHAQLGDRVHKGAPRGRISTRPRQPATALPPSLPGRARGPASSAAAAVPDRFRSSRSDLRSKAR